jgi:hypothetical protein
MILRDDTRTRRLPARRRGPEPRRAAWQDRVPQEEVVVRVVHDDAREGPPILTPWHLDDGES